MQVYSGSDGLVSVVMPFYNSERYIRNAVISVLTQTYENLELIAVNDGSTDRSLKILHDFNDPRIRIINKVNGGAAFAQNIGFERVRGDFVALFDSDDIWLTRKLEMHVQHLRGDPGIAVSYSYSQMIDSDGHILRNVQRSKLENVDITDLLFAYPIGGGSNAVFRFALLTEIRKYSAYYVDQHLGASHDVEMWVRFLSLLKCRFAGLGIVLNYYRISPASYSADLNANSIALF